MIYLVEITVATDAAGTVSVLRYGTAGYVTKPTDAPANTWYEGRLEKSVSLGRNISDTNRTAGASRLELGVIDLVNTDGALDVLSTYGVDGRPVVVRIGDPAGPLSEFTTVLTATAEGVEVTKNQATIRLRDKALVLDKPVCSVKYAGSNVLPAGREGTASDLKDRVKPRLFGTVMNIQPPCVNTARLIYQVSDGLIAGVSAVYDRGVLLTAGTPYASLAELEDSVPAAGQYRVWAAGGYFRLGSNPAGIVTCDASEGAAAADRTTAQIIKRLALAVGLQTSEISLADMAALDSVSTAEVGIWLSDETSAVNALDLIAPAAGAWWGFDRLGILRIARLGAPVGVPVVTLTDVEIIGIERQSPRDSRGGIPVWRTVVRYGRNYSPQDSDLAGAVTADRRAWLIEEWRSAAAEDSAIKQKHLLADVLTVDTLLVSAAGASAEASRLQGIHGVRRDVFVVQVQVADALAVDLGQVVRIAFPRFGLEAGRLFVVIGVAPEVLRDYIELTVWG